MWHYEPPLRDMRYVIEDVLGLPQQWTRMAAFADLDADTAWQVLDAAAAFARDVLAPTNARGDAEGCQWADARVRTPSAFAPAYRRFVDAGWPALACAVQDGGQGLPQVLNTAVFEMLVAANHAWTMYPGLLHGAYDALRRHASAHVKALFLAPVVSGQWLATMCLTEPQSGSDLGLILTRAEPDGAHTHRVTGQKIFISGGEHDLSDNIVHLVLARLPHAPPGTRGLSLFVCPKVLPDGSSNAIRCDGIERKMGIKGSATCVMRLDGAVGWLVGEPHRGLAAMFPMMNSARLHVAVQGLAHAELGHQNALRYAFERVQSRVAAGAPGAGPPRADAAAADAIALHPAIRRNLWRQRVLLEGSRLIAYEAAHGLDVAEHGADPQERADALARVSLLTPMLKAFLTENGFQSASAALQVFGGHGYLHDWGAEQSVRDSRIAMIYEGTNEIQAIDLLARKIVPDSGRRFFELLDAMAAQLPAQARYTDAATSAIERLRQATQRLVARAAADPEVTYRAADDFLRAFGWVSIAHAWARAHAVSSRERHAHEAFHRAKCDAATHCFDYAVPELEHALRMVQAAEHALAPLGLPA